MSGYINYHVDNTENKIPFCMDSAPTIPSFGYYYSGYHYLPLVDAITTGQCSSVNYAKTCPGAYVFCGSDGYSGALYYAVNPTITVQTNVGTRYVANTYQDYVCSHYTTRSCKWSYISNNYDSPNSNYMTVCVCCCQYHCNYRGQATGVGTINRMSVVNVATGPIVCDCYNGTYTYGAFPTPQEVASYTGIAICTNGIIGNKWRNCYTGLCVDFGACCAIAFQCACSMCYWRFNTKKNPTICICITPYLSSSGSEGNFYRVKGSVCFSSAQCHDVCYWMNDGCVCSSDAMSCAAKTLGSSGWGGTANSSLFKSSTTGSAFKIYMCYTYGKKYYTIGNYGTGTYCFQTTWSAMTNW